MNIDKRTAQQLIAALSSEHAATYGYGIAGSRLSGEALAAARQAEEAHRKRRDALSARLKNAGVTPPAADPVYAAPFAVTDQASALKLAVLMEERTGQQWRATLPVTQGDDRVLALDALVDTARRAATWRRISGVKPAMVPFPGKA